MEKQRLRKGLQKHLGHGTLLVSQDVVRREMLKVHDREGNLSIDLTRQIAEYGKDKCEFFFEETVIVHNSSSKRWSAEKILYVPGGIQSISLTWMVKLY